MNNIYDQSYERARLIKTVAATGTPERITARTITSIVRAGTTNKCLVTTSVPHGYVNGARVYITGCVEAEFNNVTTGFLLTVQSETTFTIQAAGTTAAATTASAITCYADIYVRQATVLGQKAAQTNNTGNVRLGPLSANGEQEYLIASGLEIYLNGGMPPETRINLGSYFVDVETNDDGVVVLYS